MFLQICRIIVRLLLTLRYRVHITGLEACLRKGKQGILFMPNHPALIDPIILCSILMAKLRLRTLVSERQVRTTILKYVYRQFGVLPMPDIGAAGRSGHDLAVKQLQTCVDALKAGDNLLFYPAGRIYRSKYENLRGNGGAARILEEFPDARVVLIRSRGLWGSDFSRAKGYQSPFGQTIKSHIKHILRNGIFFGPRRHVYIELVEKPDDFPTSPPDRDTLNRYLENFYNQDAEGNTYVPYLWYEKGGARLVPEPESFSAPKDTSNVPSELRDRVYDKLKEMSGKRILREGDFLCNDLGLNSEKLSELEHWLLSEFGHQAETFNNLSTVAAVLLSAIGEGAAGRPLQAVPMDWFLSEPPSALELASGANICQQYLANVARQPTQVLLAEQNLGVLTRRSLLIQALTLRQYLAAMPSKHLLLLLPPGCQCSTLYLATLFAGKVPLLISGNPDQDRILQCMQKAEAQHILSSRQYLRSRQGKNLQLTTIEDKLIYTEDLQAKSGGSAKLYAGFNSRFGLRHLGSNQIDDCAAMLLDCDENALTPLTLTHTELFDDLRLILQKLQLSRDDSLLTALPGNGKASLLFNLLLPLCTGLRQVYHAEANETDMLLRLTAAYRISVLAAEPQTLCRILHSGREAQLASLNRIVSLGESQDNEPEELAKQKCPEAKFLVLQSLSTKNQCG
ncbi:MAG: acyl-[ACP]--phospholipid O-acyltransferase [Oligosphaeraceae bacterium]|nr:acyl-[ACP]--phospholipid O-acyltransferase [Oligosphaeraceae bacterium]